MPTVSMTVNGKPVTGVVENRTLLVEFIREQLRLTGTHVGCDTSQCGACVIHVDGLSIKSCAILAVQAEGCQIETIESLAQEDTLHPMQEAFREHHIRNIWAMLEANHELSDKYLDKTLDKNNEIIEEENKEYGEQIHEATKGNSWGWHAQEKQKSKEKGQRRDEQQRKR